MFARFAIGLLSVSLSLAATAQGLPSLATGTDFQASLVSQLLALDGSGDSADANTAPVVPIWSGDDGHLLALVAVPGQWGSPLLAGTTAQPGPTSWYLLGASESGAGGLRWQMNNGFHADAVLGRQQSLLPSLCGVACDATRTVGGLTGSLGFGWMSPGGTLDLSYGLSWLDARDSAPPAALPAVAPVNRLPSLSLPDLLSSGLYSGTSMFAHGRWRFDDDTALDIGASYGHGRSLPFVAPGGVLPGVDLDQLSLSLGLDAGSLRGAIVGHVLRSDDPLLVGRKWTALDLGVSWRTPWSAEISVGAQNLWSLPLDAPRDSDPTQARMPYIQYRQDL